MEEYRKPIPPEILFDHRLTELVELFKNIYETTTGAKRWMWQHVESWTLKAGKDARLLSVSHGAGIYLTIAKVRMPDSTRPEIKFVIDVADLAGRMKYTAEGDTPEELYTMGLTQPNPHGYITLYNTADYEYAWVQIWNFNFPDDEKAVLKLRNQTARDVAVLNVYVDGYVKPKARYIPELRIP